MKVAEAEDGRHILLARSGLIYGIGIVLAALVSIVTGENWQAGLTLTLVSVYLVLISIRLEWGLYVIMMFAVLCIDGWTPNRSPDEVVFRLGVGHLYIMELAVYGLLIVYVIKYTFGRKTNSAKHLFLGTPLNRPLTIFAVLMPLFGIYGLILGNPAKDAFGYDEWRSLFAAIVLYFLITSILENKEKALRLAWWFLGATTITGLYSLTLYLLRSSGPMPLIFGAGPVGEGPENEMFVFAALGAISWLLFCRTKDTWKRILITLAAIVLLLNILLSQKRDPQLGLAVGLFVVFWRLSFRTKVRLGVAAAAMAAVALLFVSAFEIRTTSGGFEKSTSRYTEIVEFAKSPAQLVAMGNETFLFHIFDLVDSFNSIRLHPILGYGFGGQFVRRYTALAIVGGESIQPGIVHDQYLDFWLKMGLFGLVSFIWVLASFFRFVRSMIGRIPTTEYQCIALGLYAAMWGDVAIEIWGPGWVGGTKMPIIFLTSFALAVWLLRDTTELGVNE
jgi:hypothetical protein